MTATMLTVILIGYTISGALYIRDLWLSAKANFNNENVQDRLRTRAARRTFDVSPMGAYFAS